MSPPGGGGPGGPPLGPLFGPLVTFFAIFLFREAAAVAATIQLELVAAARAAIAKRENFMVVSSVVTYNKSARVSILCLPLYSIILIRLHYCTA